MANFDSSQARRESVKQANNLLDLVRDVYTSGKQIQTLLALYQAGSDPVFNAAINALYTASERAELAAMLQQASALVTNWEAEHAGILG